MSSKRKVALFSTSFLSFSQTFVYDEIRAHSDNYDITVFCKDRKNEDRFPFDNYHKPKGKLAETIYQNIAYWPRFNRIIKNGDFDLIHAHFGTGAVYALPYVKKYNIPFVVTFHGNDVASLFGPKRLFPSQWRYNIMIRTLLNEMSLGLVVSKELIELLKDFGCNSDKLEHFRLGIDTSLFKPSEKPDTDVIKFLMIGRFTEKKGHIYALRAFQKIISTGAKTHLTFIGDGELLDLCKQFVDNNGLGSQVTFAGVMSSQQVNDTLRQHHVLLAPSVIASDFDREGLPTVLKEALACEVPVISTWHGGIPELITNCKHGFLVSERSVDQLAERMMRFIKEPKIIENFGKAGRQRVLKLFDINKEIQTLENLYDKVISSHR